MKLSAIIQIINGENNFFADQDIDTLIIDSRKVMFAKHALFICLKTISDNGHLYINEAYQKGVRCFLVSEDIDWKNYPQAQYIKVVNTLESLQNLVAIYRTQFNYPVIGITGSNGKTIIKEWLFNILDGYYQIIRNPKSFNSQIGVALSVWEMQAHHTLGIFEAGISMPHEMQNLQKMIQPSIGIFTNIGDQHTENFDSIESHILEKLNLFTSCKTLLYNSNQTKVHEVIGAAKQNVLLHTNCISWGTESFNQLQILSTKTVANTTHIISTFNQAPIQFDIPFSDAASIENACHCCLLALHLGLPLHQIQERILTLSPIAMRLELKKGINDCSIINDSYNNDIGALHIALNFLEQQKEHEKFTVILSDILQSNKSDYSLYEEVADLLEQKNISKFIGIGKAISEAKQLFLKNQHLTAQFFIDTASFIQQIDIDSFQKEGILLKGARAFQFEQISNLLEAKIHQTVLEVNLNALVENYQTYTNLLQQGTAVMAMVKAFSYGSGAYEIANKLQFLGVDYMAVAYADEGVFLRNKGIHTPIMVMNADVSAFDSMIRHQLEPEIYSLNILQKFISACKRNNITAYPIHLKIDTGMHRLGFTVQDLQAAIPIIVAAPQIKIQSVFSHLAGSDDALLDDYTNQQALVFDHIIQLLEQQISYTFFKHLCNTSGVVRHPNLHYNMVRLGIGLYGVDYSNLLGKKIKQISRLKTSIAQIKKLKAGETVGYSRRGLVTRNSKIGTICIGYADGISRSLGNGKGKMVVNGILCSIIGNVCMDMCMLDITDVPNVQEGDEVIVFGPELPITRIAEMAGTIAYEIMTDISTRVKRVYYEE